MASALKHTWSNTIKNDSGSNVLADPPLVIIGDAETNFSVQTAPGTTDEIDATVPVAKILSGFVSSDQPVTVYTNDNTGSSGQVIPLPGGRSLSWNNTQTGPNPFTPTITKFFVTNLGTKVANVRAGFLLQE
jgi:hypothetical protein